MDSIRGSYQDRLVRTVVDLFQLECLRRNTMTLPSTFKCLNKCFVLLVLTSLLVLFSVVCYNRSSREIFIEIFAKNNASAANEFFRASLDRLSSWVDETKENSTGGVVESNETLCRFPHFDPWEPYAVKLARLDRKTLKCDSGMPDLTYVQENKLIVNKTILEKNVSSFTHVSCWYQDILREKIDLSYTLSKPSKQFTDFIVLPPETEFILVVCEGMDRDAANVSAQSKNRNLTQILSRTYFALVPKLKKLIEFENMRLRKRAVEVAPKETMSVIMIGIDSVPRYSFLRAMNRTYGLLMNEFMSFDMTMHSQVGRNSFPNVLSILTGKSEEETERWWGRKNYTDEFDLLWKDFERSGYRTLFTEDWPTIATFKYELRGFYKVPTVHYSNPISYAIDKDKSIKKAGSHCVGNQPEVMFHLEYLKRFLDTFKNKPLFALAFMTRLAHDDITVLKAIDDHLYNYYIALNTSGHLNNTLLVTFADHGLRFGPLRNTLMGDVENRTPILYLTFPPWFLKKYPDVAKNLKVNTGRLTTHYDTHATLSELLYFRPSGDNPMPKPKHGISLFREIPKNRTCQDASIPMEFCLCGYENSLSVSGNTEISKFLSETVLKAINAKLDHFLCQDLKLLRIIEVLRLQTFVKTKMSDQIDFRLKIETAPGNGIFQAVVSAVDISGGKTWDQLTVDHLVNATVGEGLDRLNMYRGQSECVNHKTMKLFCYCKDLLKT